MDKQNLTYAQKFKQLDKEAIYTLLAAIFITLCFWICIFLFKDQSYTLLSMPLWFVLSCIGGYLLSVLTVIALVKFFFKNISLDDSNE